MQQSKAPEVYKFRGFRISPFPPTQFELVKVDGIKRIILFD